MKNLYLFVFILIFCKSPAQSGKNKTILFSDCIEKKHKPQCCLSFELDSSYVRTYDTYGSSWDTDQGYGFASVNDTFSIAVYIEKVAQPQYLFFQSNLNEEKQIYGLKLYNDTKCSIQEYIRLDAFFKGKYATCVGGYSEIITYAGYYYDETTKYEVGITIYSSGPQISKERESNIRHLIETIKVSLAAS